MFTNNTTLILTGGGMRCAWSGGLLYGLNECGIHPKCIVATSGNAGNATYFSAGQYDSIKRIWTEHLPGSRFISFLRPQQIIDIDYLIDDVFHRYEPIHWETVRSSKTQIICPIHAVQSETVKIGSNQDINYEFLRASKALPVIYGKDVILDGVAYRDFAFTPSELCDYAPQNSDIVVIDVRMHNRFLRLLGKPFMRPKPEKELSPEIRIVIPKIESGILTRSKETLSSIFEDGRTFAHNSINPSK